VTIPYLAQRSLVVFLFGEASSLRRVGNKAPALLESGSFPSSRDVGKEPYAELKSASLHYGERSSIKKLPNHRKWKRKCNYSRLRINCRHVSICFDYRWKSD